MRALVEGLSESLIRHIANAAMDRPGVIPSWFGESDQPTAPRHGPPIAVVSPTR